MGSTVFLLAYLHGGMRRDQQDNTYDTSNVDALKAEVAALKAENQRLRTAAIKKERIGPMTMQPGKWGAKVNVETGGVTSVEDGQSKALGVEKDWFIIEIDGKPYSKDLFTQKKEGTQAYQVVFSAITVHKDE